MFAFIKKFFSEVKTETKYSIVEIEKEAKLPEFNPEIRESLKTLQFHPGFVYLQQKLKYEKAMLAKYLHEGFQLGEKELHHLQAGIYYLGYLEREIANAIRKGEATARAAANPEVEAFDRIVQTIEHIG